MALFCGIYSISAKQWVMFDFGVVCTAHLITYTKESIYSTISFLKTKSKAALLCTEVCDALDPSDRRLGLGNYSFNSTLLFCHLILDIVMDPLYLDRGLDHHISNTIAAKLEKHGITLIFRFSNFGA